MMKPKGEGGGGEAESHSERGARERESQSAREEGIKDGENGKQRWSHLPGHLLQSSL